MKRKFKSGDRVKTNPNNTLVDCFFISGVDYVGTVIGYDDEEDDLLLVKFDNFTDGHSGYSYYCKKGINYDPHNEQHFYMREENLCLLEGEEYDN